VAKEKEEKNNYKFTQQTPFNMTTVMVNVKQSFEAVEQVVVFK